MKESLDEPEAKAAMVWIVGEYAEKIENAADLVSFFLETFKEEHRQVKIRIYELINQGSASNSDDVC